MPDPVLDTRISPLRQPLIDDMNMRRFSSAASCCTSCRAAFIASATTACSPKALARPASHSPANCWTSPRRPMTTPWANRRTSGRHARAAADA